MTFKRSLQAALRSARGGGYARRIIESLRPVPEPLPRAVFNFTIDFELCWGTAFDHDPRHQARQRALSSEAQARNFEPFVRLLERTGFPVSWAVLGKLADARHAVPEGARFRPSWHPGDWYAVPEGLLHDERLWNGERYLDSLRATLPSAEILSHGYAHIDYRDRAATEAVARADITLGRRLLESRGFRPEGFVYPCNKVGHEGLLRGSGFKIARGGGPEWSAAPGDVILSPVGFWISPGALSLADFKRIVDHAIELRAFVHPWMHLVECDLRQRDLQDFYRPAFDSVREHEARGELEILNFGGIARRLAPLDVP